MLARRIAYLLLFIFCTWLALATRHHHDWFPKIIVVYGGDVIWAGMFLFLLRIFFTKIAVWKLALINYLLGVLDECSQLITAPWFVAIRQTKLGKLMLGVGFVWSDLICYAIGTLLAWVVVVLIEKWIPKKPKKSV
jgi:hypothetical protein